MLHELKLDEKYCGAVYWGVKTFEIRKNDRDFKLGDFVRFIAVNSEGELIGHKINSCYYQIEYILTDFCGLADNYIAFDIRPHKCFYNCCERYAAHGIEGCFGCTGAEIERQQGN